MKLVPSYNYSLNCRVQGSCAGTAILEPDGRKETLVAVSTTNTIIIKGVESSLHVHDRVRALSFLSISHSRSVILLGTDAHIIAYDPYENVTLFQKEVPDGVNCFAVGQLAELGEVILCGGNCAIWGFDSRGKDVYWTVTGDQVTSLALSDLDGDGQNELIVGSQDFEIRLFKNDLMREEIMESDIVTHLAPLKDSLFAYALANGSIGVYDGMTRLWRSKAKVNIASIFSFPSDGLIACVWQAGKIDIRKVETGEVVVKESFTGQLACAFPCKSTEESQYEMTMVFVDGKVRGFQMESPQDQSQDVAALLREYGQKKHNLLVELNNFEQEEQMAVEEKDAEYRIPANTTIHTRVTTNLQERRLEMEVLSSNNIPVRACVILAEGIFKGESHISLPLNVKEPKDHLIVPLYPQKDHAVEMHIHTFIGNVSTDTLHAYPTAHRLTRFSRFVPVEEIHIQPQSYVQLDIEMRSSRLLEWVADNFSIQDDSLSEMIPEPTEITLKFLRLKPCNPNYLLLNVTKGKLTIELDEMEAVAAMVQSMAEYMAIDNASSRAVFPEEMTSMNDLISNLNRMYSVRDRLATDISEKQSLLKEILLRAEDAVNIDDMPIARKYFNRMRNVERAVRQDYLLGSNNHESLVTSLRGLHKIIDMGSKLRIGEPSRSIITSCRQAISDDNFDLITKIIEFGSPSQQ